MKRAASLAVVVLAVFLIATTRSHAVDRVCAECSNSALHCCLGSHSRNGAPYCAKLQDFGQMCRPGNVVLPNPNPAQPRIYLNVCPCKPGLTCSKTGFCQ